MMGWMVILLLFPLPVGCVAFLLAGERACVYLLGGKND
jgi:hypothetical protein